MRIMRKEKNEELPVEKKSLFRRIIQRCGIVLLALVILVVVGIFITACIGKRRLKNVSVSETGQGIENIDPQEMTGPEVLSSLHQANIINYNGKSYVYNDKIMTFLFMGIDKMEPVEPNPDLVSGGQSDAMFLAVLNPDIGKISIIAVNRDSMVEICMVGLGENGEDLYTTAELTVQHGFGDGMEMSCELTRDAVSRLFYGIPIHGYVSFNLGGVGALNDALGGVTVTVVGDMSGLTSRWPEGSTVTLFGFDAYEYIRWRDITVYESARQRLERLKGYLKAAVELSLEKTKQDITLPVTLYQAFEPYIVTDLSVDEIIYLSTQLTGYRFDGDIYSMEGTTVTGENYEEFYPDEDALKSLVIQVFFQEVDPVTGAYITN